MAYLPPAQRRMAAPRYPAKQPKPDAAPLVDSHGRKTLSFDEFHSNTGGDPQGYQKYLRYVHNVRAAIDAKAGAPTSRGQAAVPAEDPNDPATWKIFAPTPEALLRQQAQRAGLSAFNPAIQQENTGYAADQRRVGQTLTNYTRGLAAFLQGAPNGMEDMRQVQSGIAASNAALAGGATGQAQQGLDAFSHWLQTAHAPAGTVGADIAARGQSVAGDIAAAGQAGYEGAAARQGTLAQYLATLPSIAAMTGRRTLADELSGLAMAHTKPVGDLHSQLANAIQKEYANLVGTELQKGAARATFKRYDLTNQAGVTKAGVSAGARVKAARIGAAAGKTKAEIAAGSGVTKAQIAADARVKSAQIAAAARKAAASGPNSKARQTQVNQATTKAISIVKTASGTHKVTETVNAPNIIGGKDFTSTLGPSKQKVTRIVHNAPYYEAITQVKAAVRRLLPWMSDAELTQFAQEQVNAHYPPGKYGRPKAG